jgi:hypothetical protein
MGQDGLIRISPSVRIISIYFFGYSLDTYPRCIRYVSISDTYPTRIRVSAAVSVLHSCLLLGLQLLIGQDSWWIMKCRNPSNYIAKRNSVFNSPHPQSWDCTFLGFSISNNYTQSEQACMWFGVMAGRWQPAAHPTSNPRCPTDPASKSGVGEK